MTSNTENTTEKIATSDALQDGRRIVRRRFLKRLGGGVLLGVGATAAYGAAIEPNHPRVERVTVRVPKLPAAFDGFRIGQLSDLHVQKSFSAFRLSPAVELLKAEKPDLIALTGDYVNFEETDNLPYFAACAKAFSGVTAPHGFFVTFGNHDFPAPPADPPLTMWEEIGARPLLDTIAEIERGGERFILIGFRSAVSRAVFPDLFFEKLPKDACKVVLWHEPDRADEVAKAGGNLQLSGHTHGGQVILPFVGAPLLPYLGKKYPSGLFEVAGMPLYVTRGIGLLPPMLRLNCPPEVTILTLRPA
jgi:predicted MPP superfamily phosphohydrolase